MKKLIKPNKLQPGDTIAAITLSWGGAGLFPYRYEAGKKRLQEVFGLNVIETNTALRDPLWIHQNPRLRALDLMEAFKNPNIKGIFSIIGGNDSIRILPFIDYDIIKNNPKIFMGFSDSTITHFMCVKAGIQSFYGPAIMTAFAENVAMHPSTVAGVNKALFSDAPIGLLQECSEGWTNQFSNWDDMANQQIARTLHAPEKWRFLQGRGKASGHLLGGCIEVLQTIIGTELWPALTEWDNTILFIESSEEGLQPAQLERFLHNLATQKILQRLRGLLFSKPGGHQLTANDFGKYDDSIKKVLQEFDLTHLPVVTRMDFGHTDPMLTLPYGAELEIDCDHERLTIKS